jgi:hypothetical protein
VAPTPRADVPPVNRVVAELVQVRTETAKGRFSLGRVA